MRDICREAGGANLNAINYYFGGKKKLYQTILEVLFTEGNRQLRERLDEIGEVPPEERLRLLLEVCCRLFFTGSEVCRAFMRLWIMELANPTPFLAEMVERYSRPQIEDMLDKVAVAFRKQLDGLFAADVVDITADIAVMEQMMAAQGLTDQQDFKERS